MVRVVERCFSEEAVEPARGAVGDPENRALRAIEQGILLSRIIGNPGLSDLLLDNLRLFVLIVRSFAWPGGIIRNSYSLRIDCNFGRLLRNDKWVRRFAFFFCHAPIAGAAGQQNRHTK